MNAFTDRSWANLLVLLLASVFPVGCFQSTEQRENSLRVFAKEFVTELEIDVVEEQHSIILSGQYDVPSSWITSKYVISDSAEDIREKLNALHSAKYFWIAPSSDGWIGDVELRILQGRGRPQSPTEFEEYFKYFPSMEGESGIDFFVICPWSAVGVKIYTTMYSDRVILTESGALIVRLHSHGRARERCHDVKRYS